MSDNEFNSFLTSLREYLEAEKVFVKNPLRERDVDRAIEILDILFPDATRSVRGNHLQTGALVFSAESDDMVVRGEEELALFAEFTSLIDNFEVYAIKDNQIRFAAILRDAFVRIK